MAESFAELARSPDFRSKSPVIIPILTGNREAASRQGVWKREGTEFTMLSLDDLTDGTQNLCKSILDVASEEFEMTFYPMP